MTELPDLSSLTSASVASVVPSESGAAHAGAKSRRGTRHTFAAQWRAYYQPYLDAFARLGALSASQLTLITGHSPSTVRTVLADLGRLGYAVHHRISSHTLYYLTSAALQLTPFAPFAQKPNAAFGMARHDFAVNSIACVAVHTSEPPLSGVLRWLGPAEAKEELAAFYGFEETQKSKKLSYIPDAYLELNLSLNERSAVYSVVLEVDMGTEPLPRLVRKMETGVRALAQHHDGNTYNILWVFVDHNERMNNAYRLFRARLTALVEELPKARVPNVFIRHVAFENLSDMALLQPHYLAQTGDMTDLAARESKSPRLTDFVGVSQSVNAITNTKIIRTQIPALTERM